MATTWTIGAAGTYTTIVDWANAVKAVGGGTLDDDYIGELIDNAIYPRSARSDLDFSAVTLNGFTITLRAEASVKHDGDFGNGARVEQAAASGGLYGTRQLIMEDMSFYNTELTAGGSRVLNEGTDCTYTRVICKTDSSGANCEVISVSNSSTMEAVRCEGGTVGINILAADVDIDNVTVIGSDIGIGATVSHTSGTIRNVAVYNCTTDWSGTFSGTYSNNASEDGTTPAGAGNVLITADPFEADGYTPAVGGQLDGAGVDLSILLDAANNAFAVPPSIGAYEVIGVGPTVPVLSNPTTPVYTP